MEEKSQQEGGQVEKTGKGTRWWETNGGGKDEGEDLHLHLVKSVSMSMREVSNWKGTWNLGSSLKEKQEEEIYSSKSSVLGRA